MKRLRILIVDDDPTQYEVLGEYLERAGFEVSGETDGRTALQRLAREPYDLVCLDVRMPKMDGFQILREIRRRDPDLPVLFISGVDSARSRVRGLELGADDYITKPFDKTEVLARVRAALRRSVRAKRLQNEMTGRLEEWGIFEILQVMELANKTTEVLIEEGMGTVIVVDGRVCDVRFGPHKGLAALQRIALLNNGGFVVRKFDPARHDEALGPCVSVQSAIMDAAVAQDEALALVSNLGGLEETLVLANGAIEGREAGSRATLLELLIETPGDLREAAARIKQAFDNGLIHRDVEEGQ